MLACSNQSFAPASPVYVHIPGSVLCCAQSAVSVKNILRSVRGRTSDESRSVSESKMLVVAVMYICRFHIARSRTCDLQLGGMMPAQLHCWVNSPACFRSIQIRPVACSSCCAHPDPAGLRCGRGCGVIVCVCMYVLLLIRMRFCSGVCLLPFTLL